MGSGAWACPPWYPVSVMHHSWLGKKYKICIWVHECNFFRLYADFVLHTCFLNLKKAYPLLIGFKPLISEGLNKA